MPATRLPPPAGPAILSNMDAPRIDFDADRRLAVCRPGDQLGSSLAARLLDFVLAMEATEPESFDRLLDLTAVEEVRLSGAELYRIAQARRAACAGRPAFRTAILAPARSPTRPAGCDEAMTEGCGMTVAVFRDAGSAAAWLGVPLSAVRPAG